LRTSGIRLVLTRHEQAAGFTAATCGRLTGKPGVCLATLGPGATNLVTAAAFAQLGGMPMLMIGASANRNTTSRLLRELVSATGLPFFTTQLGKGVVDETHPLWLGNAALSDGDFVHRAIERADCIINAGHDVIEKPPFRMQQGQRTVIHINYFSAEVDTVYFPQIEVVGDVANSIWRLRQALQPQAHWDFDAFDRIRAHLLKHLAGHPNTLLPDNALATMGAGLPAAMAAS
jgi:thiamine pyrophosphate-dependent acetolactate synthase large subunit-like protein